jgi:hypothetical protein
MTYQSVTIQIPSPIYKQIAQRAKRKQRTLEDEVASVVTNAIPVYEDLSAELTDSLDSLEQLAFLNDAELWQAAKTTLPAEASEQMQRLVTKQQQSGLTTREQNQAEKLVSQYQHTLLVRAQAALLLKERGHRC